MEQEWVRNIGMRKNGKGKGTMKVLFNKQYLIILQNKSMEEDGMPLVFWELG